MSLQGWQELSCDKCGEKQFTVAYHLLWQSGGGTTHKQIGHRCLGCGQLADNNKMINAAKRVEADAKIKELEASFG